MHNNNIIIYIKKDVYVQINIKIFLGGDNNDRNTNK